MYLKLTLFSLVIGLSGQAHSTAVDLFDCEVKIEDADGSVSISQAAPIALVRMPAGTQGDFTYTRGTARLSAEKTADGVRRRVDALLTVRHAIQQNPNGPPVAYQSTHFSPVTYFCDRPSCLSMPVPASSVDPGSPEKYGTRVAVFDGVPGLDLNQIRNVEAPFGSDRHAGVAKVSCKHNGTLPLNDR